MIEFGGSDAGPFIQMPAALSYPMNMSVYDWGFQAEPEAGLNGRSLVCPRGKVIGGSSSINGMIYVRGNPLDYDHWRDQGATGWGYADVLPYFRRMETSHGGEAPGAVRTVLCISHAGHAITRCITPLLRRPHKLAIPPRQIITASARKALDQLI